MTKQEALKAIHNLAFKTFDKKDVDMLTELVNDYFDRVLKLTK